MLHEDKKVTWESKRKQRDQGLSLGCPCPAPEHIVRCPLFFLWFFEIFARGKLKSLKNIELTIQFLNPLVQNKLPTLDLLVYCKVLCLNFLKNKSYTYLVTLWIKVPFLNLILKLMRSFGQIRIYEAKLLLQNRMLSMKFRKKWRFSNSVHCSLVKCKYSRTTAKPTS